ncbi:HAMP domain-containing sensor histidine kinase [Bacteroides sp. GD17]|jgi:signal transduction histidine kinase|uniref:sensor histidine kinase n=1 Tax=Bacteroides sp. GD17 TaxID=3139826 RepID=UPI0025E42F3A|nr:HAMP domain-containing sensor histidine kinase [uncultured Bacteroides sp.]
MTKDKKSLSIFMLHFLEQLNGNDSIEKKVIDSLAGFCNCFQFKRGFVYQTDGFRYFFLKETAGCEEKPLPPSFEMCETIEALVAYVRTQNKPFYTGKNKDLSLDNVGILNFFEANSLLIRHFEDTEGKVIGFIGFADKEDEEDFSDEELRTIHLLLGSLSKEIAVREYKEREVRASNTLSSIMNNMGVDIYVNSFDSHDMLYANESMAAPYGGIEHFRGKKCWEALYTDKKGECEFCPKKHLIDENGQPTKVYSWDYQRPFDKCWFRVFSAAFAWIDGQMAHVITSVDIDHQKKIEEELRIAKDKAENLDRLKSAFLANMSHEIRTPLNSIVGFASLLVESEDKEERQEYIEIMQENTELLLQLISDILDLSKIEAGTLDYNMGYLNVRDFCEDVMRIYDIKEDKPVPVLLAPDLPDYRIYTDKKRLTQVVTNFINNALKFTTEGQILLEYHLREDTRELEFSVTDTGMGIAPEAVNTVFDRFVKLNTFSKGTGLGLSICRSIVEHLGGAIGAESEVGVGSRFWFTHPCAE